MIEFCTKKRMIVVIAVLITVSVIILVVENHLPIGSGHETRNGGASKPAENVSKPCAENNKEVIEPCQICTESDMLTYEACRITGFRTTISCTSSLDGSSKNVVQSCPRLVSWEDEKRFWIFEGSVTVVGLLSYIVVYVRQRRLDRLLIEKVHRQIAAGV